LIFSTLKNLELAIRLYQERMGIEEKFKDLKSYFGLEEITLKKQGFKEISWLRCL